MWRRRKGLADNRGISLVEILVSVAIIAVISVPLINSFITAGRINRNGKRLQSASNLVQSVTELTKLAADTTSMQALLASISSDGLVSYTETSEEGGNFGGSYSFYGKGEAGEDFLIELEVVPKAASAYDKAEFIDVYGGTTNIYKEMILYDASLIHTIGNMDIIYDNTAQDYLEITKNGLPWQPATKAEQVFWTYLDLFSINETNPLVKSRIEKDVEIEFYYDEEDAAFKAAVQVIYKLPYEVSGYTPITEAEELEVETTTSENEAESTSENLVPVKDTYAGEVVYMPEPVLVNLNPEQPIYIFYAEEAAGNAFKKVQVKINNGITDAQLGTNQLKVYVVRQGSELSNAVHEFQVSNQGITPMKLYSNINTIQFQEDRIDFMDEESIAYNKAETIYTMYDMSIRVFYNGDIVVEQKTGGTEE